ncbi:MAG: cysteine hydrolase [Cyanobacteria bacterium J06597_1]
MPVIRAQPYDYNCPQEGVALLLIDMQRDFMEVGGFGEALGNDVSTLRAIVPTVKSLLEFFRVQNLPVIHTLECHQPDMSDCPPSKRDRGTCLLESGTLKIGDEGPMGRILIRGEMGNAIIPEVAPLPDELCIYKPGKGAFYNTKLDEELKSQGITHLIVGGVTTEVCVQSTMREANDRGYECLLVEDATESYFPEFKQATLEMVRAQGGIIGWTACAIDVMAGFSARP